MSVNAMTNEYQLAKDSLRRMGILLAKDVLSPQQRNWLYMILKALYDSRFDGSFDDNDMQTINTIMHDLDLYYDSSDEESK